ncbi:hypothetical protein Syun_013485 [Stephania yunnanensis]|uniref:Uncharacterized protein n=1 Tax=Stephania yunnanensis TaxID=152371 RepID=A0AAP0PAW6_9MAGN
MKREAMRMYENLNNDNSFKFEHCRELLKQNPKWCSKELTKTSDWRKQKWEKKRAICSNQHLLRQVQKMSALTSIRQLFKEVSLHKELDVRKEEKLQKKKKRRLNEEKGVADALYKLQSTLESHLKEDLEQRKEKDKKDHELKEHATTRELEVKENAQKRREQERILNTDVSKLPLPLQKEFDMHQTKIMREWKEKDILVNTLIHRTGCSEIRSIIVVSLPLFTFLESWYLLGMNCFSRLNQFFMLAFRRPY